MTVTSRIRRSILGLTLGTTFFLLMTLLITLPAKADSVTVTNNNDSGVGSLRQAIANAIDGDTILFDSSLNGQTITLTSGELLITKSLTIDGPGANLLTISGDNAARVFNITSTVTISGVTITDGTADAGGGIFSSGNVALTNSIVAGNTATSNGGGIVNSSGNVTLTGSIVSDNTAAAGGAIFSSGSVALTDSSVVSNTATSNGGGIVNSSGNVTLTGSIVSDNTAAAGGAIFSSGSVTLTDSSVVSNTATSDGGGIFNIGEGSVTLTDSSVVSNTATSNGGGIVNNSGNVTLTNSTVSNNTAAAGGAIFSSGSVTLTNGTVASNTATVSGGGIVNLGEGSVDLANTIVANSPGGADCVGIVTSQGYNLDSDNTCSLTATGDITSINPLLGPLQDNGGATLTHALLIGSPALDHIPSGANGCGTTITSDQRNVVRPQGLGCDIGAYEAEYSSLYLPLIMRMIEN